MSDAELSPLRAIMVEEEDLDLFPDRVVTLHDRGEGLKAHAVLRSYGRKVREPRRRARIRHHLSMLRLWAEPGSAPNLFSLNGIGTRMYGNAQPAEDGSYISTMWLTFVYLPVVPIESYVVQSAEGGGWYFLGRTPHPPWIRGPVFAWLAVVAVILGVIGVNVLDGMTRANVLLYNGFSSAVEVRSGERTWTLAPEEVVEVRLPASDADFSAGFVGAEPFEHITLPLSDGAWRDTIYNVGCRRVLVVEHIAYGPEHPEEDDWLLGPVHVVEPVDFTFVEPPNSKSVYDGETIHNTYLHAIVEEDPAVLLRNLFSMAGPEVAGAYARSAVRDGVSRPEVLGFVMNDASGAGRAPEAVCAEWLDDHPEEVERHRYCQNLRPDDPGVAAEYAAKAEANPASAMYAYLAGRVVDGDEARRWMREALARDPDYARAHFAIGYHELVAGDPAVAEEHLQRALALDPALGSEGGVSMLIQALKLQGVSEVAIADQLPEDQDSLFTMAQMLKLVAEPSRLDAEWERLEAGLAEYGGPGPQSANMFANAALIAGDLDRLRAVNADGGGMEMWLALSDGATEQDRAWVPPEDPGFGGAPAILALLLAEQQQRDASGLLGPIEAFAPELATFLQRERDPPVDAVRDVLTAVPPSVHAAVWFVYFRRTGDPEFGRLAKRWSLPADLPCFTVDG